jgi:hypothetical protein
VISYQVARAVAEGKLQVVLREFEPEPMPVHLIHAAQGRLPLKMRSFLEFAAPRLRKSLERDEAKLATKRPKQGGAEAVEGHRQREAEKAKSGGGLETGFAVLGETLYPKSTFRLKIGR